MAAKMNTRSCNSSLGDCVFKDKAEFDRVLCCECCNVMDDPVTVTGSSGTFNMCNTCFQKLRTEKLQKNGISIFVEPNKEVKRFKVFCKYCKWEGVFEEFQLHKTTSNDNINQEGSQALCNCHKESKPKGELDLSRLCTGIIPPPKPLEHGRYSPGIMLPHLYTRKEGYKVTAPTTYECNRPRPTVALVRERIRDVEAILKDTEHEIQAHDVKLASNALRIDEMKGVAQSVGDGISEIAGLRSGAVRRFFNPSLTYGKVVGGTVTPAFTKGMQFPFNYKSIFRQFCWKMSPMNSQTAGYSQHIAGYCVNIMPCYTDPTSFCIKITTCPSAEFQCNVKIEIFHPDKGILTSHADAVTDHLFYFPLDDAIDDDTLCVNFVFTEK